MGSLQNKIIKYVISISRFIIENLVKNCLKKDMCDQSFTCKIFIWNGFNQQLQKKPSITFLQWFARGLVKLKYVEPGGVQQIL